MRFRGCLAEDIARAAVDSRGAPLGIGQAARQLALRHRPRDSRLHRRDGRRGPRAAVHLQQHLHHNPLGGVNSSMSPNFSVNAFGSDAGC